MATTITLSEATRRRLADYKRGDSTFDEVLNELMDRVPVEDVAVDQIEEHYRRLKDFRGIPAEEFQAWLRQRIAREKAGRAGRLSAARCAAREKRRGRRRTVDRRR